MEAPPSPLSSRAKPRDLQSHSTANQCLANNLLSAVLEDLFRQVILYLGLIAHDFVIGGS